MHTWSPPPVKIRAAERALMDALRTRPVSEEHLGTVPQRPDGVQVMQMLTHLGETLGNTPAIALEEKERVWDVAVTLINATALGNRRSGRSSKQILNELTHAIPKITLKASRMYEDFKFAPRAVQALSNALMPAVAAFHESVPVTTMPVQKIDNDKVRQTAEYFYRNTQDAVRACLDDRKITEEAARNRFFSEVVGQLVRKTLPDTIKKIRGGSTTEQDILAKVSARSSSIAHSAITACLPTLVASVAPSGPLLSEGLTRRGGMEKGLTERVTAPVTTGESPSVTQRSSAYR